MRHQNIGRQLSRNSSHRAALMRNMAAALLRFETIRTTLPKAKELRRVVEPLITLAKEDSVAKRRLAFSRLRDDAVVAKLFTDIGPHYKSRPGGYTQIFRHGMRPGDSAPMAIMRLVDRAEIVVPEATVKSAKAEKAPKAVKQVKAEKPAKADKAEKPAKKTAPAKTEKSAKAEKKPAAKKAAKKADK